MDLRASPDNVHPQTARASSTAETRQQLIQLLPFVSEQRDAHDALDSLAEDEKRTLVAPGAGTIHDQPRGFASSWSMTSNILQGHDVNTLSLPGPCLALSSESNTQTPLHQHTGQPLDLSRINSQPQHAHCSAPVNSASHPRSASISALQQYINAAHLGTSIDDGHHLPSHTDAAFEHGVSASCFDLSASQLHHAPSDVLKSGPQAIHQMNLPSSVSCSSNTTRHPQALPAQSHHAALQPLQLQTHHAVHQFLPLPSTSGVGSRAHTLPAAAVWPPYSESFSSGTVNAYKYHQSAPEHISAAAPMPMQAPNAIDSHLHAYMSHPKPVPGLPQPGDSSGLGSAPEMHLARLSLGMLPETADAAGHHPGYPLPVPSQASGMPSQSAPPNKSPDWCVVTGLMLAPGHSRAPEPSSVVSVTTMLLWPPGIRSALQAGQLCLTLDPTELECRGSSFLPSLVFTCPHSDEATMMATLKGVYRCDMFHGRADLAEPWRMPHSWETGTGEVTVREMSGVRLVLSRHGFSLLPSTASATFLCMQSLIAVLGNPALASLTASSNRLPYGSPALSSVESTPGRLLLWEVIRSATSVATHLQSAPRESRAPTQRVAPPVDTSRGGWLQRLNHEKQKQDLSVEWHDRQLSDLTWISTLLVNGAPVNSSDPCVKKQDARDSAARSYLVSVGACE